MEEELKELVRALRYDGDVPEWVVTLQVAKEWATPPWEIENSPRAQEWVKRWMAYNKALREVKMYEAMAEMRAMSRRS